MKFAIVGIGCRLPGSSNSPKEFFENLKNKKDCVVEIPNDRWNKDFYHDENNAQGKIYTKRGGFMDHFFEFDNEAFKMSQKEASSIDPQQKILLEVAHQALEDANINYRGTKTGVFIGTSQTSYNAIVTRFPHFVNEYTATGTVNSIQANMISYRFDLRGPSLSVDTACSSSGYAMYLACNSIKNGDCDMALVGGINELLNVDMTVAFSQLGVLSPDGKCKSFDESANGYVRSEGCGIVVIKPYEKALQDGDHIYCVLRETVCNEDGALSPSLTMPSEEAQKIALVEALKRSNVDPNTVFYVEAHATGTKIGDPTEVNTIGSILSKNRTNVLRIGSVKSNIGHCETASYIAGLIKCALMLDNGVLLPNIHFKNPNPKIKFDEYKLKVQNEVEEFDPKGKIFTISSFGFGGANCCSVIEGVEKQSKVSNWKLTTSPRIYIAKAQTKKALEERIRQYKEITHQKDEHQLMYTLNTLKSHDYKFISFGLGEDIKTAKFSSVARIPDKRPPLCFVFSGQGPQNIAMGRDLYVKFPVFRETIDKCDALYKKYAGFSVVHDLGLFGEKVGDAKEVDKIRNVLPGLIFVQVGLFELWKSFGLKPDVIIGHSFGEMCAMYASKSCSLETVIEVTALRAKLMEQLDNTGLMLAVGCSQEEILKLIKENNIENIWTSAINSPKSVTMGGTHESIKKLDALCEEKKYFHRILNVTNAYHTPLLSPLREKAVGEFNKVPSTGIPRRPVISTVIGDFWKEEFTPEYFWLNIENPVLFKQAIELTLKVYGQDTVFLELAPHPVLAMSIKQCGGTNIFYSMSRREDQQTTLLNAVGQLSQFGFEFNWNSIIGETDRLLYLPVYPFQRSECFREPLFTKLERLVPDYKPNASLIGVRVGDVDPTWRNCFSTKIYPWLEDHVVDGVTIFPGAGYVELALEVLGNCVENVEIKNALIVPTDSTYATVHTIKRDNTIHVYSMREDEENISWRYHAKAEMGTPDTKDVSMEELEGIKKRCTKYFSKENCYKRFKVMNLSYGPNFQCVHEIYQGDEESYGILTTTHLKNREKFILHPAILDCCFQAFLGAMKSCAHTYLPTSIGKVQIYEPVGDRLEVYSRVTHADAKHITGNIIAMDGNKILFKISGFSCTVIPNPPSQTEMVHYTNKWQTKTYPSIKLEMRETEELKKTREHFKDVMKHVNLVEQVIANYLGKHIQKLLKMEVPQHRKKYLDWIKSFLERVQPSSNGDTQELLSSLEQLNYFESETKVITKIGENFEELINQLNARETLINDDNMSSMIEKGILFKPNMDILTNLIKQTLDQSKDRIIRILEISSGAGGLTSRLLPLMESHVGKIEYIFSDKVLNSKTQKKFKKYSFVQYKQIDIDQPITKQGIDDNSVDIVISFDSMRNAKDISRSLNYLSNVLVENGLVFLMEQTSENEILKFINGIQDENDLIKKEELTQNLTSNGFKQIETFGDDLFTIWAARNGNDKYTNSTINQESIVFKSSNYLELLDLVHDEIKKEVKRPLIIVTRDTMDFKDVEYGPIIGFGRVIANEYVDWCIRMVDLPKEANEDEWVTKIQRNLNQFETEFAIRNDEIYVPRLVTIPKKDHEAPIPIEQVKAFQLRIDQPGLLDTLRFHAFDCDNLDPKQVLVQVKSAALNFKDIMLAMNMLSLDWRQSYLGLEFSGTIIAKGSQVTKFEIGDDVFGMGKWCLASHVIAEEDLISIKPKNLTHEEASSIPAVFITPYYALMYKAHLDEGQKVLVHSAAGGIGQATIQLVKWKNGEIYATVGSESKRKFLKEKYGVTEFGDSHSMTWDEEIRKLSNGGVDVVLNSLAGEHIEKGINILNPYGSFIEIGKRDILNNSPMRLRPFIRNLSYYSVHLDYLTEERPKLVGKMLKEISELFRDGVLSPIVDQVFPANRIHEAFRLMQAGKHMGKIVINFEKENYPKEIYPPVHLFSPKKTYVLSGGLGAVGFEVAKWMADQGARYLVLTTRSGSLTKYQKREIERLKERGVIIVIAICDVCKKENVEKMYADLTKKGYPSVKGIIHLAMVLNDNMIAKMTKEAFEQVMKPKLDGAKNLLGGFKSTDLDFIVFFSSISAIIGNPEQSNYAAGNSFLDYYANFLSKNGYPARVINLGAVDDVGVVANDFALRTIMKHRGLEMSTTVAQVCESIKEMLLSNVTQHIPHLNLANICSNFPAMAPRFRHLISHQYEDESDSQKEAVTLEVLSEAIGKILHMEGSEIDPKEKLTNYGVDSLLAVEIAALMTKKFDIKVSQMDILGGITLTQLLAKSS